MTAVIALVAPNKVAAAEWASRHPDLARLCKPIIVSQTPPAEIQGLRVCHIIWLDGAGMMPGSMRYRVDLERQLRVWTPTEALEQLVKLVTSAEDVRQS